MYLMFIMSCWVWWSITIKSWSV